MKTIKEAFNWPDAVITKLDLWIHLYFSDANSISDQEIFDARETLYELFYMMKNDICDSKFDLAITYLQEKRDDLILIKECYNKVNLLCKSLIEKKDKVIAEIENLSL